MTKSLTLFLVVMALVFSACNEKVKTAYLNLDFEDLTVEGKPKYWTITGDIPFFMDRNNVYSGEFALCMENKGHIRGRTCQAKSNFYYGFPVEDAQGKTLCFSGYIKTEDLIQGGAGLRIEVDTQGYGNAIIKKDLAPLLKGTLPWTQCSLEITVPKDASRVLLVPFMEGEGRCWFDCFSISLDGEIYKQVRPEPLLPTKKDLDWIREKALFFADVNPKADHEQLMPILDLVGSAQVVGLGEGCHGTSEFIKMKHRVTRFLVEKMGFTVIAIEAGMTEILAINHFIQTGEGDPREGLAGLKFWTWDTREVMDFILWMREYRRQGKGDLEFYGLDSQFPLDSINAVIAFIEKYDSAYLPTLNLYYAKILKARKTLLKKWEPHRIDFKDWRRDAGLVLKYLETNRERLLMQCSASEYRWVVQHADMVGQAAEMYVPGMRNRDESMADNLNWIMADKPRGTKAVIWAHNAHVSKAFKHFPSLGSFLKERIGKGYLAFAFTFHQGTYTAVGSNYINVYNTSASEPGSLEWFFYSSGIRNCILDIRKAGSESGYEWLTREMDFRSIIAVAQDYSFTRRSVSREFDCLVYIEESTPSQCFRIREHED